MDLARLVLTLAALAYGFIAVTFTLAPAAMGGFVGLELTSATADNDVRAVYGGVALGLTVFLWLARSREAWVEPALFVVLATLGAMASARFLSWLLVGLPEPIGLLLHASEIAGFALAGYTLRQRRRAPA